MSFKVNTKKDPDIAIKQVKAMASEFRSSSFVKVGIIAGAGKYKSEDGKKEPATIAAIGTAHEFGLGVPERSFLRSTVRKNKKEIRTLSAKLLKQVVRGEKSTESALGLLGLFLQGEVQQRIVDIKTPPNTPETIARKGSSNPLVDTGQLRQSISYEVEKV